MYYGLNLSKVLTLTEGLQDFMCLLLVYCSQACLKSLQGAKNDRCKYRKYSEMQTSTFVTTNPTSFTFIGSISKVSLSKVPSENVIIQKYRKLHVSGERPITDDLEAILDVGDIPKLTGVK